MPHSGGDRLSPGGPVPGVRVGIVGGGLGALVAHTALRFLGMDTADILVVGEHADPFAVYRQHAWGVGQTVLHSDPLGHFLPADWPTPGVVATLARPTTRRGAGVADLAAQARAVAGEMDYARSFREGRIADVVRSHADGEPHFGLYSDTGDLVARARHVLLAVGHGPLVFPPAVLSARSHPLLRPRVVHAYEAKRYVPGGRYLVVGGGLAAVNEWVNCLRAGAQCVSVRRDLAADDDLTAPRCLFDALGVNAFQGLSHVQRMRVLRHVVRSHSASSAGWDREVARAVREGRFREIIGEVAHIGPGPEGIVVQCDLRGGGDTGPVHATGLTAATGFDPDPESIEVLRRIVARHSVPRAGVRLALGHNCGLEPLDVPTSRLCVTGFHASLSVPHADTVAGLKYIGRRFAEDVMYAEGVPRRSVWGRARAQSRCVWANLNAIRRTPVGA